MFKITPRTSSEISKIPSTVPLELETEYERWTEAERKAVGFRGAEADTEHPREGKKPFLRTIRGAHGPGLGS